jgi:V8-like Glu-specific endopeptidase
MLLACSAIPSLALIVAATVAFAGETSSAVVPIGADDRNFSNNPAVGRIVVKRMDNSSGICTGWLISTGHVLTAGHCFRASQSGSPYSSSTIQFNVPASRSDGARRDPPASSIYSLVYHPNHAADNGIGDDWAVLQIEPNAAGSAFAAQKQFFRLSPVIPVDRNATVPPAYQLMLTGYGADYEPPGTSPSPNCVKKDGQYTQRCNAYNVTEQFSIGAAGQIIAKLPARVLINYFGDSLGGSSGGPYEITKTMVAVAIHFGAGQNCNPSPCNGGTVVSNVNLVGAISQSSMGASDAVYFVDVGAPAWTASDATALAPERSISDAISRFVSSQASEAAIVVTAGYYGAAGTTISAPANKTVKLVAAAGDVYIGPVLP